MTVDKKAIGTHFSEIVAASLNAELQCYAKLGASNFVIRLQIDEAIKQNPDLILIGFTSVDRIEVPLNQYHLNKGIKNIKYSDIHIIPEFYDIATNTVSAPISNFTINPVHEDENLGAKKITAIKYYSTELYDSELKRQLDFFLAQSALDRLEKLNIPFVFTRGGLTGLSYEPWSKFEVDQTLGNPWLYVGHGSNIYHTTIEKQKELADEWLKLL